MALNREQKRMLQKQGELGADGNPARRERRAPKSTAPKEQRTGARQFAKEVRSELRKVAWPTRAETINYSIIVLVTLVLMTGFIALVDFAAYEAIVRLFDIQ